MKIKELFMNAREYSIDGLSWLRRKIGFANEPDMYKTYAGRQLGMWAGGFNQKNLRWINRLYNRLLKVDPTIRLSEPSIQQLLDNCRERGLCSQNLYRALEQYGDQANGLPLVIDLEPAT